MGLLLHVNVDAVDDVLRDYGVGAKLYWARDNTSSSGAFTDATGSVALEAGKEALEIYDATGQEGQWYRTRVGNTGGTDFGAWSTPFQAGALQAYASVVSLRESLNLPDDSRDNFLADCLRRASDWISDECRRDFYRHPAVSGTETRTYHLEHDASWVPDDIISITSIEYATVTGGAYTALSAGDWILVPARVDGVPYDAFYLSDVGALGLLSHGYATVRVTGVFGFPKVPGLVEQAALDLARELYQQGPGGKTVGVEFGRLPLSVQRAIAKYGRSLPAFA